MNERCPVCGLVFERESGYFLGAMYFSYFLAVPILGLLMVVIRGISHLSFSLTWVAALIAYLPLIPLVFRISRVLWIHFDRSFDPDPPGN